MPGWNELSQRERDQLKAPPGSQIESEKVEDSLDDQIKVKELELVEAKIANEKRLGLLLDAQTAKAQIFYAEGLPQNKHGGIEFQEGSYYKNSDGKGGKLPDEAMKLVDDIIEGGKESQREDEK